MGEPLTSVFWEAVRDLDPELHKAFNPWDEITSPEALAGLFERAGVTSAVTEVLADEQPIAHPNEAWDVVLGSGLRGTVDALAEERREALRERVLATLRARGVTGIKTDVVLGRASRGPPRAPAETYSTPQGRGRRVLRPCSTRHATAIRAGVTSNAAGGRTVRHASRWRAGVTTNAGW